MALDPKLNQCVEVCINREDTEEIFCDLNKVREILQWLVLNRPTLIFIKDDVNKQRLMWRPTDVIRALEQSGLL